jgi:hypothetical protein
LKLRIDVTAKDIKEGDRFNSRSCPVALGFLRAVKEAGVEIAAHHVTGREVYAAGPAGLALKAKDGRRLKAAAPTVAKDFMMLFDTKQPVQPFSFEIDLKA